ncbi:Zinc finger, RING-type [Dillenia turbinata]|uniref:RING-type E3 ubiquitin transferase n=1 Tax=Dillenia turbinata TaxID=194707 RepID=A0AAN8ZJH5_9MAGN
MGCALIVAFYQCLTYSPAQTLNAASPPVPHHREIGPRDTSSSSSGSRLKITIPTYRHTKESEEGTCSICLSEFMEEEEIRVLPECAHAFHVPCIDKWLYSHSNCPFCRADIRPPHLLVLDVPNPRPEPSSNSRVDVQSEPLVRRDYLVGY